MIKRASEIMDDLAAQDGGLVYDRSVLLGERGSLAGARICFDDVGERSPFADKPTKLANAFQGTIDLEHGAINHDFLTFNTNLDDTNHIPEALVKMPAL